MPRLLVVSVVSVLVLVLVLVLELEAEAEVARNIVERSRSMEIPTAAIAREKPFPPIGRTATSTRNYHRHE